jgi:hypothetical protein
LVLSLPRLKGDRSSISDGLPVAGGGEPFNPSNPSPRCPGSVEYPLKIPRFLLAETKRSLKKRGKTGQNDGNGGTMKIVKD